jgi:hypothetical protein
MTARHAATKKAARKKAALIAGLTAQLNAGPTVPICAAGTVAVFAQRTARF